MIKQILFISLLLLSFSLVSNSFSLLTEGKLEEAKKELEEQIATDSSNPLALYNLGVISEKSGDVGDAVFYYVRALSIAPTFSEAEHNLNRLAEKNNLTVPKQTLKPARLLTPFFLLMGAIYLFVFLLIWHLFKPQWKIKIALVPLILIILLLFSWFIGKQSDYTASSIAIIRVGNELKSGPDSSLSNVGTLKEGEVVRILAISGKWCKVESVQDNVEGWVSRPSLGMIERSYR